MRAQRVQVHALRDRVDCFPDSLERRGPSHVALLLFLGNLLSSGRWFGLVLCGRAYLNVSVGCFAVEGPLTMRALFKIAVNPRFWLVCCLILILQISYDTVFLFGLLSSPDRIQELLSVRPPISHLLIWNLWRVLLGGD